ncbi:MAG: hypothetical protein ACW9XA_07345 [Candidatus Nitrosopumilus sp. bin_6a]
MNKLIIIPVFIITIIAILTSLLLYDTPSESKSIYGSGFTYYDIEKIQDSLTEQNIFVSAPAPITDHTISQYCTFFEDGLLRTVEYCTTTAVLDSEGTPLGNINIGGDIQSPFMAVANIETKTLNSNPDEISAIFETMIKNLVCDCWEEESVDYPSITAWLEAAQKFYSDSNGRNIKSKIDNLHGHQIILEITSKENSVLQTLVILK